MPSLNTKDYPVRARWVCEGIAAGKGLEQICAEPGMPQLRTVRRWLLDSPDFRARYARAKRLQAERLVEQVVEIADGLKEAPSEAEARRQRLRIDARKWAVAQLRASDVSAEDEALGSNPVFVVE